MADTQPRPDQPAAESYKDKLLRGGQGSVRPPPGDAAAPDAPTPRDQDAAADKGSKQDQLPGAAAGAGAADSAAAGADAGGDVAGGSGGGAPPVAVCDEAGKPSHADGSTQVGSVGSSARVQGPGRQ
jgi:hypothetical protein